MSHRANGDVLERARRKLRAKNRKLKTEQKCVDWISDYLGYWRAQDARPAKEEAVRRFIEHLAVDRNYAYATQRRALHALNFLYTQVYESPLGDIGDFRPSSKPESVPVLYSPRECQAVLRNLGPRVGPPGSPTPSSGREHLARAWRISRKGTVL